MKAVEDAVTVHSTSFGMSAGYVRRCSCLHLPLSLEFMTTVYPVYPGYPISASSTSQSILPALAAHLGLIASMMLPLWSIQFTIQRFLPLIIHVFFLYTGPEGGTGINITGPSFSTEANSCHDTLCLYTCRTSPFQARLYPILFTVTVMSIGFVPSYSTLSNEAQS